MDKSAKMPDFKTFADSIAGLAPEIEELSRYRITGLSSQDTPFILGKLWSLITRLQGSMTKSKLVANSKILHHLLPNLVPPIDRANTAIFFGFNIQGREKKALGLIFPQMVSIAQNVKLFLNSFNYQGFNSSETKLIDNAIIGYLFKHNLKGKKHGNEQRSVSYGKVKSLDCSSRGSHHLAYNKEIPAAREELRCLQTELLVEGLWEPSQSRFGQAVKCYTACLIPAEEVLLRTPC